MAIEVTVCVCMWGRSVGCVWGGGVYDHTTITLTLVVPLLPSVLCSV